MWIIPIISGFLFRVGGTDQWPIPFNQKLWRWLMGIPIGLIGFFTGHGLFSMWCVLTYYIATNIPYGEHSFLNVFGEYGKWFIVGFCFGLASFPMLLWWSMAQAIVSGVGFGVLHWLDEKNIVKNPFQEMLRGVGGTILYVFI